MIEAILPPEQYGTIEIYDPETGLFIFADLFTAPNGFPTNFFNQTEENWQFFFDADTDGQLDVNDTFAVDTPYHWYLGSDIDSDADNLVDDAEIIYWN